jgi:hypothetical protein
VIYYLNWYKFDLLDLSIQQERPGAGRGYDVSERNISAA